VRRRKSGSEQHTLALGLVLENERHRNLSALDYLYPA
jgi:hypothetical protein